MGRKQQRVVDRIAADMKAVQLCSKLMKSGATRDGGVLVGHHEGSVYLAAGSGGGVATYLYTPREAFKLARHALRFGLAAWLYRRACR